MIPKSKFTLADLCRAPPFFTRGTDYILNIISFLLFSESQPTVWLSQRLETIRLQLLQAEGRHPEELVRSQIWLFAGRSRPGVRYLSRRRAVPHRNTHRPITVWPLDWAFHTGERNIVWHSEAHLPLCYWIWIFSTSMWRWALFLQKCNKISCEVEAGNSQFTWSDAIQVQYTNWADGEPTV